MEIHFAGYLLKPQENILVGPAGIMELGTRSSEILVLLLSRPNGLFSKSELFDRVWPGVIVEENTLQVHISALRKVLGAALITTVHGRGYKYTGPPPATSLPTPDIAMPRNRKPVVAVLPFDNLSGDPNQQYFSDGITDDIIDRLSRHRILSVIGRHSTFALRDMGGGTDKLAADFVVTGNIRRDEKRIRVSVRLTNAKTGMTIWADHYDRSITDLFSLQDEVVIVIASTLMGRVEIEVANRGETAHLEQLSSYEHVLQGMWHFKKVTIAGNFKATACFERAIADFSGNAQAYRWLAACENNMWLFDFNKDRLEQGLRHAELAIELDPTSADCYSVHGVCQLWLGGLDAAEKSFRKSLELNPGDANANADAALFYAYRGDSTRCKNLLDEAFRLNPIPPIWYSEWLAVLAFSEGRYSDAISAFLTVPDGAWDTMYALACFAHLQDQAGLNAIKRRVRDEGRHWDFKLGANSEPYASAEVKARLLAGLQIALSD